MIFRTFAPNAEGISLIGEFSKWEELPMNNIGDGNFYELFVPNAREEMMYKYKIIKPGGYTVDHADPYGFGMELRPASASIIRDLEEYTFADGSWMRTRGKAKTKPMNIYEVHLGSWRTNPDNENGWYTYAQLAEPLIAYVKKMGYNYIELMPISEHPCDESWGYQNTGFFAPTARYGTADDLRDLIEACHLAGIGVLLDFVPIHFALDDYGLAKYDGTALYEYPHQDVGVSEWGSCNFMHSRGEVRSFLQSSANYWMKEYHFDGLRMDAISRIIYWQGDEARGVNLTALEFLKGMNAGLKSRFPTGILIAEDSTNYPGVTKAVEHGGLGFDYKWDLGWMNDTLDYFKKTPKERVEHYHKLTFSMAYYYNEDYLMPLSHDEVVHGKATIIQKMYGDYEEKFPQARALYLYMMAHPGKKLNFMGNELGQFREWDEKRSQDWNLLDYPIHRAFNHYMQTLNTLYLTTPALSLWDYKKDGFTWLDCEQNGNCMYAFTRCSPTEKILAIYNFSDTPKIAYGLTLEDTQAVEVLLHSDWEAFGGSTKKGQEDIHIAPRKDGIKMVLTVPAYTGILLKCQGKA